MKVVSNQSEIQGAMGHELDFKFILQAAVIVLTGISVSSVFAYRCGLFGSKKSSVKSESADDSRSNELTLTLV